MSQTLQFFQSPPVLALLIALLIFLATILLVVKRWIGFSITLLLLFFSLTAGLIINNQQAFQEYLTAPTHPAGEDSQDAFQKQMMQALEDLKLEVNTEKENLRRVMNQVKEIFDLMDAQKQKLQNFIEETRERIKTDYPTKQSFNMPERRSDPNTYGVNNYEGQF